MGSKKQREGRKQRPLLERIDEGESKFARALGSVDYHTREAGLQALTAWLCRKHDVAPEDMLRLFKALFMTFWHSDKSAVQIALAERLSEIMAQLPEETGWLYYRTFVRTMRREWFGIDRLRLDKFMMLIRKFFAQLLRQLQAHSWQERRVRRAADFWYNEILAPSDTLAAAGVAYHLTDLLLTELAACLRDGGSSAAVPDDSVLRMLLEPFCRALATTRDPALVYRLRQGVFDPLVSEVRQPGEGAPLRHLDVAALAAHLFDLGAQPETRARNREALYAVSAALEKAAAKRQRQAGKPAAGSREEQQQAAAAMDAEPQQGAAGEEQQQAAAAAKAPASSKKGKKRRQAEDGSAAVAAAAAEQQEQQAPAGTPVSQAPPTTGSKKSKKSRLGLGEAAAAESPASQVTPMAATAAAAAAADAPATTGSKKLKKSRLGLGDAAAASPAGQTTPAAAAAAGAGEGPATTGSKKLKKSRLGPADAAQLQAAARQQREEQGQRSAAAAAEQERQQPQQIPTQEQELLARAVAAVAAADGMGMGTPRGAGIGAAANGTASTAKKKNVRFSLKRNLVNVIGQPPKPADVRTPPTSKPKGPALKKESQWPASAPERLMTRGSNQRLAEFRDYMSQRSGNGSGAAAAAAGGQPAAPATTGGGGKKHKRRMAASPAAFSRPRASEFF